MRAKNRFNIVLILGLMFWALTLHSLYSSHFRIAIEERSLTHFLQIIPGNPFVFVSLALVAAVILFGFVAVMNRRVLPDPYRRRRRKPRHRFTIALFGLVMLCAGCYVAWRYPHVLRPQELSGAVAVFIGASLFLFAFVVTKRRLLISHLILVITAAIVVILIQFAPGHRDKARRLEQCMKAALSELENRQHELGDVDPDGMLARAAAQAVSNLVYRFDDNLSNILDIDAPEFEPGAARDFSIPPDTFATVGYENVDGEIRRAMFIATPCTLTYYGLIIPAEKPRMHFGVAALDGRIPTTFEVAVRYLRRRRTIYAKTLVGKPEWSDHWLDLSRWAGERVDVIFRTTAKTRTFGIWSSPVMTGTRPDLPNVVIFLNDALRADHLGSYGYGGNTSPFFDRLTADGTLFEWAFANATKTIHSIPSLFSSNPSSSTGIRKAGDPLPRGFPTLAEILRAMGYSTAAFSANPNTGPQTGTHRGFSSFLTPKQFVGRSIQPGDGDVIEAPDMDTLIGSRMETWIERNTDRNFFLFIHAMSTHRPYDPPAQYRHFYEKTDSETEVNRADEFDPSWIETPTRESRVGLYDGEIAYADDALKRFYEILDSHGLMDSTLFVFVSDHGEYFGEHGLWGHGPPGFVQGTHVPLLIIGKGFPAGVRIDGKVQLLDIAPTVLDALGFVPDSRLFQGASLKPIAQGKTIPGFHTRPLFVEGDHAGELSFRCDQFHMFPEKNIIFDLAKDPDEMSPLNEFVLDFKLKSLSREVARRYMETYSRLHDTISPMGPRSVHRVPDTEQKLRSSDYAN
ncbi:MAG: sulfatase [Candidatus Latescibacterota bacterium]|nr:MAG: sulfatase [Candidatus Latescibacterota bacterium]